MIPDLKMGGAPLSEITTIVYIWFSRLGLGIFAYWELEYVRQCVGKRRSGTLQRARSRPITLNSREDIFERVGVPELFFSGAKFFDLKIFHFH